MTIRRARLSRFATVAAAFLFSACASGAPATQSASTGAPSAAASSASGSPAASPSGSAAAAVTLVPAEDIKGQAITVMVPDWANVPADILADFTAKTGVKVTMNVTGFDSIRDKVAVAGAAKTPLADVVEMDWTWTGQFAGAGWYEPLDTRIDPAILSDMPNTASFSTNGRPYAACYSNDFRIAAYNTDYFKKGGVTTPPATFDELLKDLRAIKASGATKSPLAIPLSATEGTSSAWFLLTTAMGGKLIDDAGQPAFTDPASPGYKAFDFLVSAYKEGLISAGAVAPDANAANSFNAGAAAITLTSGPDELVTGNDPKTSKIVGKVAYMLEPGATGPGGTIGSPEGLGIMASSTHKAAAAAFISWWMQPETLKKIQAKLGLLPCRASVIKDLIATKTLVGGDILSQQLSTLQPLFPNGAPVWYNQFSTDASSQINAAARGDLSVADAIKRLADNTKSLIGG